MPPARRFPSPGFPATLVIMCVFQITGTSTVTAADKPPAPGTAPVSPTPSANILRDFAALEKIHAVPAKAREAISRSENLRNALANDPVRFQKLHFFWGIALGNSGEPDAAAEKLAIASAGVAPDQALAVGALNADASFALRDPARVDCAIALVESAISRSKENSPEQLTARFHGACALFILGESAKAAAALKPIDAALRGKSGDPKLAALKENASNLLSRHRRGRSREKPAKSALRILCSVARPRRALYHRDCPPHCRPRLHPPRFSALLIATRNWKRKPPRAASRKSRHGAACSAAACLPSPASRKTPKNSSPPSFLPPPSGTPTAPHSPSCASPYSITITSRNCRNQGKSLNLVPPASRARRKATNANTTAP